METETQHTQNAVGHFPFTKEKEPTKEEKIISLERKISALNTLCHKLNPYVTIPDEIQVELKEYGITDMYDPFNITNKLLVQLEDSIEELHSIRPCYYNDNKL